MRRSPLIVLLLAPALLNAQGADEATLVIRRQGQEIGIEHFKLSPARQGRAVGDSLVSIATFPAVRPLVELRAGIERSPGGGFSVQFDQHSPEGASQVFAASAKNRVTVRTVAKGSESAREFPGGDHVVILDDSLFAFFLNVAERATEAGDRFIGLYPRAGRRITFTAQRRAERATVGQDQYVEIRLSGGLAGSVYLDLQGRLVRVDLPEAGLEASRTHD